MRKNKNKKKEKEKKMRKNQSGKKISPWGENQVVRERGKENIFLVFQRSELDSPRTKVGLRNESYAWVAKSKFFVEAPRSRGFLLHWFLFT